MKLAAIDIGSNACRLLIDEVITDENGGVNYVKVALVRVPLRLGFDVFDQGKISPVKAEKLLKTMQSYKLLLEVYEINHLKACATSAMRDASNASEILKKVKQETGIDVKVITGKDEAAFIYENHVAETLSTENAYLYIDVGGGSTELTCFHKGQLLFSDSFDIGTIRLLKNKVSESSWQKVKDYISHNTRGLNNIIAIGSGGNINKVFNLSNLDAGTPLPLSTVESCYNELRALTVEERMVKFELREDRADVIVPAMLIYLNVMSWARAQHIYVPKIGLADGLIHILYQEIAGATSR